MHQMILVLVGGTGAGKSSVGSLLERNHGWTWVDVDAEVERTVGMSIEQLIRVEGEQRFRVEECKALNSALVMGKVAAEPVKGKVITVGAGAVTHQPSKDTLLKTNEAQKAKVIWLDCSPAVCAKRTLADELSARALGKVNLRPMLGLVEETTFGDEEQRQKQLMIIGEKIQNLSAKRSSGYSEVANALCWTEFVQPEDIAKMIEQLFVGRTGNQVPGEQNSNGDKEESGIPLFISPQKLESGSESTVVEGRNSIGLLATFLDTLKGAERAALLYDSGLPVECVSLVKDELEKGSIGRKRFLMVELPNGETAKSFSVIQTVTEQLASEGFSRKDPIIALGGGVTGDVSGLVASLYMRGVPLFHLPTTIVAAVDSAIGGKTAVNLKSGKNMVGTFYPANAIIIDPIMFKTLPVREFNSGLAEVIKYGVMFSDEFLVELEKNIDSIRNRDAEALSRIIRFCATCKQRVVGADLTDTLGHRALLNFGHTFGHALENLLAYRGILHGEAVAIGMMVALKISIEIGKIDGFDVEETVKLQQRVARLLQICSLPISIMDLVGSKFLDSVAGEQERTDLVKLVPSLVQKGSSEGRWKEALTSDKKRTAVGIDFVGVKRAGDPFLKPLTVEKLFSLSGIV